MKTSQTRAGARTRNTSPIVRGKGWTKTVADLIQIRFTAVQFQWSFFHLVCCGGSTRDGRSLLAGFPTISVGSPSRRDPRSTLTVTRCHSLDQSPDRRSMAKTAKNDRHAVLSTEGFRKSQFGSCRTLSIVVGFPFLGCEGISVFVLESCFTRQKHVVSFLHCKLLI